MAASIYKSRILIVLYMYNFICEAAYTREQCPTGIQNVLKECVCRDSRRSLYVNCQLGNAAFGQFPVLGQINKTLTKLTIQGGYITTMPADAFSYILVSRNTPSSGRSLPYFHPFMSVLSKKLQQSYSFDNIFIIKTFSREKTCFSFCFIIKLLSRRPLSKRSPCMNGLLVVPCCSSLTSD